MTDIKRRGFLFGAGATLILPPKKTFFLMPPIIERGIDVSQRPDLGRYMWQVYREIMHCDTLYDVAMVTREEHLQQTVERVQAFDMKARLFS